MAKTKSEGAADSGPGDAPETSAHTLARLLDRLGGDGVTMSLNGATAREIEDEIFRHVRWLEQRERAAGALDAAGPAVSHLIRGLRADVNWVDRRRVNAEFEAARLRSAVEIMAEELRAIETHHRNLNAKQGRPEKNSTTLKMARRGLAAAAPVVGVGPLGRITEIDVERRTVTISDNPNRCACGHMHAAGSDGEDGGCKNGACPCNEWTEAKVR